MAREFSLYMDESYKENRYSWDEWGCAELVDEENRIGVDYNFCYDNGECCCAMYRMGCNDEGYWSDDCSTFVAYEIDFDNPDWRAKLEKTMNKFLDGFIKKENEND